MTRVKTSSSGCSEAGETTGGRTRCGSRGFDELLRLMARETGREVCFELPAPRECAVFIAGTFNDWNPSTHRLQYHPHDAVFRVSLYLPCGTHEYKFVVDGVWHLDPRCPHWTPNAHGTLNSVICIGSRHGKTKGNTPHAAAAHDLVHCHSNAY